MSNDSSQPLFLSEYGLVSKRDIQHALQKCGIQEGDTIMVHSDLRTIGRIGEIQNRDDLLTTILQAFLLVIGTEGTIIVPTYTYTFCNNPSFDVNRSKSQTGIFSEFIRNHKDAIRSIDPIFSHAGIGKNADILLRDVGSECFGKKSFFERFYHLNGKIINFGKFFDITFLHFIEKRHGVSYRYDKKFSGRITDGENVQENRNITFYVRALPEDGFNVAYNMPLLGTELEKRGLLRRTHLGNAHILCSNSRDCYSVGIEMLKKDEYAFLKFNPVLLKIEKLPFFIGYFNSPDNKGLPTFRPFILEFDRTRGLIKQHYSVETERLLEQAYILGSLVSTNLGQGSFGVRRAKDLLKFLVPLCEKNISDSSFLEIGCADGYILNEIKKLGAAGVTGCEPGAMACEGIRKFGLDIINDFYNPALFIRKFDVIFSYGVFEHIVNPLKFINSQMDALNDGGIIFTGVPNCEEKLKLGDVGILGHEHWNYFTRRSLEDVFLASGLAGVQSFVGMNEAMIYACGRKMLGELHDKRPRIDDSIYYSYCQKVKTITGTLRKRVKTLDNNKKTLGLYAGGLNLFHMLDFRHEPRFFNGDTALAGKFYPGCNNPIESPFGLVANTVDELWIMAVDYDDEIKSYLINDLQISEKTSIFSYKDFLKNFKDHES